MTTIRATVAMGGATDRAAVQALFPYGWPVEVSDFVDARPESLAGLTGDATDALVVACASEDEQILRFITAASEQQPATPLVVICPPGVNGFVREAIAAGADDLVTLALGAGGGEHGADQVLFALEKAIARKDGASAVAANGNRRDGSVISILGPKGGTGKTLTTCNLGASLAKAGQRVIVVDLDLQFGDVGLALGLAPEKTVYDLATSGGGLDAEKLDGYLVQHDSGMRVLIAPRRPDEAGAVTTDFLRVLFPLLRDMSDYVLIDTPPGFTPEVIAAIDASSEVCLVAMLDSLSLKNTKLAIETLKLMGVDGDRVRLVLNRADSKVGVTGDDVESLLGRAPDVLVPSHRDITRCVNEGSPISIAQPGSEAARAFKALAASYIPSEQAAPTKRRLFRRRSNGGAR